jgi:predicted anti-sigma-YlaC factor YlaD
VRQLTGRRRAVLTCAQARDDISARLDGEPMAAPPDAVEAHLAVCAPCARFAARASALGRHLWLRTAKRPPDTLLATITAAGVMGSGPGWRTGAGRRGLARWADAPALPYARTARWASATVPAALGLAGLLVGVGTHPHLVPTRPSTPCTAGLHSRARP